MKSKLGRGGGFGEHIRITGHSCDRLVVSGPVPPVSDCSPDVLSFKFLVVFYLLLVNRSSVESACAVLIIFSEIYCFLYFLII